MRTVLLFLFLPSLHALRGQHPSQPVPESCIPRDNPSLPPQPLLSKHINDEYCHCLHGEDEPGTSACPNGTFWCQNVHYKPVKLPSSFVDDGSCDCCDGSDEPNGRCPDVCKKLRRKEFQIAEERAGIIRAGVEARRGYVKEAQKGIEKDTKEIKKLEKEIKEVERKLKQSEKKAELLRKRKEYEERLENTEDADDEDDEDYEGDGDDDYDNEDNDDALEVDDEKYGGDNDANEDEGDEDSISDGEHDEPAIERDESNGAEGQDNASEVDNTLGDGQKTEQMEEADPASQADSVDDVDRETSSEGEKDPPVEDSATDVSSSDQMPASKPVEESPDEVDSICAELESHGPNAVVRFFSYFRALMRSKLGRLIPKAFRRKSPRSASQITQCLQKADSAKWDLESRKRELESSLEKLKEKNKIDYGSDGALRQLHGSCHKKKLGQYEFEHCPFDLVRQYEHGSAIAILGRFSGWEAGKMSYPSGDHCWNGPARSIVVELTCGKREDIVSVEEPNRCAYSMKFETPAVCEEAAAEAVLAEFKANQSEAKEEL